MTDNDRYNTEIHSEGTEHDLIVLPEPSAGYDNDQLSRSRVKPTDLNGIRRATHEPEI